MTGDEKRLRRALRGLLRLTRAAESAFRDRADAAQQVDWAAEARRIRSGIEDATGRLMNIGDTPTARHLSRAAAQMRMALAAVAGEVCGLNGREDFQTHVDAATAALKLKGDGA